MMEEGLRRGIVEALIFAAEEPVSLQTLADILEISLEEVTTLVAELRQEYDQPARGLRLAEVAGGLRFTTRPDYHPWVKILFRNQRTVRLSRAALQILAIVAYKQPVTGPEIEEIRGVDAAGVLKNLLDKHLVKILGRKDVVGRPILYGTTREFLIQFGLKSLDDLPSLEEFEELLRADLAAGEAADVLDTVDGGEAAPSDAAIGEPGAGPTEGSGEAPEAEGSGREREDG